MSTIVPFRFDDHDVRVHIAEDGTPWWEAKDVCAILDIRDVSQAVTRLHVGEKRTCETRNVLIINESGLYRLIFRSNKPEAARFQDWVFGEVLPTIRKTGQYIAHDVIPPERKAELALIRQASDLLSHLGHLTPRDTLMLADQARNVMTAGQRLLPAATTTAAPIHGFSVAERVAQLGYQLTRSQQAALVPKLGKRIAEEWRRRYEGEPAKENRWVDGAQRLVAWYAEDDAQWVDVIVQSFLTSLGVLLSNAPREEPTL